MASQAIKGPPKKGVDSLPPPTNGFPKSNKDLVKFYLREAKLVTKLTNHFKDLEIKSKPSILQGSSDPLAQVFAEELNAEPQRQPAPPASSGTGPSRAEDVELPSMKSLSGPPDKVELSRAFKELIYKLSMKFSDRFIAITNPNPELSQKETQVFRRLLRCLRIKPRGVKVLSRLPTDLNPVSASNFEEIRKSLPKKDQNTKVLFSDFSYVSTERAYWVAAKQSARRMDGYLIREIPAEFVLPEDRPGYFHHLCNERAEDVKTASDEERRRHAELKQAVEVWISRESQTKQSFSSFMLHTYGNPTEGRNPTAGSEENEQPQNMDLEEDNQMPSLIDSLPAPRDVLPPNNEELDNILASGSIPVDSGNSSESHMALSSPCNSSSSFMTEEDIMMESSISFMVESPLEDEHPSPDAKKYTSEFLKIKPDLKACGKCGDNSHAAQNCVVQSADGRDETSKNRSYAWFVPNEGSLAATGGSKMLSCSYRYCRNNETHTTAVCPDLHQRCAECKVRGHDDLVFKIRGERDPERRAILYETHCPSVKKRLVERENLAEWEVACPSYQDLQLEFEKQAPIGIFTKYRFNDAGAGWYPATSEKDIRIIRALGYRSLATTTAEESVTLLSAIHSLCKQAFAGTNNLSFEGFPDEKWTIIHKRREDKRSLKREESKLNKAAKKAETAAAKNARLPRDNSPGSGPSARFAFGLPTRRPYHPPSRQRNWSTSRMRSRSRSPPQDGARAHQPVPVTGPSNPVQGVTPPHGEGTSRANPRANRQFGYTYSQQEYDRWGVIHNNPSGRQSGFRPANSGISSGPEVRPMERIPKIPQGKGPNK